MGHSSYSKLITKNGYGLWTIDHELCWLKQLDLIAFGIEDVNEFAILISFYVI